MARNLFTVVVIMDPAAKKSAFVFKALRELVLEKNFPVRVGFAFATPTEGDDTAKYVFGSGESTSSGASQAKVGPSGLFVRAFSALNRENSADAFEFASGVLLGLVKKGAEVTVDLLKEQYSKAGGENWVSEILCKPLLTSRRMQQWLIQPMMSSGCRATSF